MHTETRNWPLRFLWVYIVLAVVLIYGAAMNAPVNWPPLTPEEARRALAESAQEHWGSSPDAYPVRDLKTEPLVVRTDAKGKVEWAIGHWRIQPDTHLYHLDKSASPLGFFPSGHFEFSWGQWKAVTEVFEDRCGLPPSMSNPAQPGR